MDANLEPKAYEHCMQLGTQPYPDGFFSKKQTEDREPSEWVPYMGNLYFADLDSDEQKKKDEAIRSKAYSYKKNTNKNSKEKGAASDGAKFFMFTRASEDSLANVKYTLGGKKYSIKMYNEAYKKWKDDQNVGKEPFKAPKPGIFVSYGIGGAYPDAEDEKKVAREHIEKRRLTYMYSKETEDKVWEAYEYQIEKNGEFKNNAQRNEFLSKKYSEWYKKQVDDDYEAQLAKLPDKMYYKLYDNPEGKGKKNLQISIRDKDDMMFFWACQEKMKQDLGNSFALAKKFFLIKGSNKMSHSILMTSKLIENVYSPGFTCKKVDFTKLGITPIGDYEPHQSTDDSPIIYPQVKLQLNVNTVVINYVASHEWILDSEGYAIDIKSQIIPRMDYRQLLSTKFTATIECSFSNIWHAMGKWGERHMITSITVYPLDEYVPRENNVTGGIHTENFDLYSKKRDRTLQEGSRKKVNLSNEKQNVLESNDIDCNIEDFTSLLE